MEAPMASAQNTGTMPMKSEMRAPKIRRESMSRPSSSVPSGKPSVPGGLRRRSVMPWKGSCGASHGAKIAIRIRASTINAAITATGSRRKRRHTVTQ